MGVVLDVGAGAPFSLLQAFAALLLVGALAWLVARLAQHRKRARADATLVIEERLPLDLRGALVVVRVDQRRFLLATSAQAPARLIAELSAPRRDEPST